MPSAALPRLTFGLVAATSEGQGAAFDALAAWMRKNADIDLERRTWPTYKALLESVREGTSDVAWLPPVVYAWLAEAVNPLGYIARGDSSSYAAALITVASSRFQSVNELRGARVGWVDPWSAAGYVVPRIELAKSGIQPHTMFGVETFFGSHSRVIAALQRGDCDVAGTYAQARPDGTFAGPWSTMKDVDIHVITTFTEIPSDVIAARRNLAPNDYEHALRAFRLASESADARPHLRIVFGGDTFREGVDAGHAALRSAFDLATAKGLFD